MKAGDSSGFNAAAVGLGVVSAVSGVPGLLVPPFSDVGREECDSALLRRVTGGGLQSS